MSDASPSIAVCPACVAFPVEKAMPVRAATTDAVRRVELSLPTIHCAACISGVESGLARLPEVQGARVNLTQKRVSITIADSPGIEQHLIDLLTSWGYPARELDSRALDQSRVDKTGRDLLARLAVAGFAAMNVMLLSVAVWAGAEAATRDMMHWLSAVIALPTVAFSGVPFFRNAWTALRVGRLNMDVPISLALILASGVSLAETIEGGQHAYFDAALSLTFFLLIGRYLDHRTRAVARSAAAELAALEVQRATRVAPDGKREVVPMDAVRNGDLLAVAAGERLPADGVVQDGRSELDPSMLTGETMPQLVQVGDRVHAGMLNLSGPLTLRVENVGEETVLKQIARLVETAESTRNRYTSLADKAAKIYAPLVHLLSAAAFLFWGVYSGDWRLATNIAAAVLIITCPCALGLAVPAVLTAASGRLFRNGVLLKEGVALERLAQIDTVVFDKTGTLTSGQPRLLNTADIAREHLVLAASLAQGSHHPLAKAIAKAAGDLALPSISDVTEHPGLGTVANYNGQEVKLGRASWCGGSDLDQTATWLKIGDADPIAFIFEDSLRPEAPAVIRTLQAAGLPVHLLSGDTEAPVRALAARLGIESWTAAASPAEKVAFLNALANKGRKVLMVGDGLNDAAALAAAHVSASPASAVDASRTSADFILTSNDLRQIPISWHLAKSARKRILENFSIAAIYNMIAIPVALTGLATPLLAALAMSGSSISVSLNALRLGARK